MMGRFRRLLPAVALFLLAASPLQAAEEASITVQCGTTAGTVNPLVFGQNFIGYDPDTYEDSITGYSGYTDYGAGIWDPVKARTVETVAGLAREAGITIARFPGGCGAHKYNWKKSIGPGRKRFLYGIDEFMKSCAAVRSQAVYTLSYYIGDERDAADLVEYLNAPCDGSNPNGGTDWAGRRRDNGHPEPYNVIYFEVGNEEWHGDHRLIRKTDPEAYARRYLKYYSAMKAVEPRIQVGVIMHEPAWNTKVLDIVRGKVDFGTLHPYPQPRLKEQERELERMKAEDLFEITLAREILVDEYYIKRVCELMKEKCGKPVPLAITEYNAGFTQEKPVPYRHSLGAALVNAEFLRILMKPENSILMANFWQFCNSYWGMVYSPVDFMTPDPEVLEYVKRPSFYVYQLYASRFGEELLSARVRCPTFTIEGQPPSFDLGEGVPELPAQTPLDILTVNASRKKADGAVCLMVVNKSMEEAIPCSITLEGFSAGPDAVIRVLNGPEIAGTNEDGKRDVGITESSVPCADNRFAFSFPAHSVTSIEVLPAPSIVTGENNVH